jgi:hypothetical protein
MVLADRADRLDSLARAYAREGFALIFTQSLDKRFGKGWPEARRVTSEDFAAALVVGRCHESKTKNPRNVGVSLEASGVVGVEIDTAEGRDVVAKLGLPSTWTVQSGRGGPGRHLYFRPPAHDVPYFSFRLEAQGVTADTTRGFVLPPSIHPETKKEYTFDPGHGPGDVEIATMPRPAYDRLVQLAKADDLERDTLVRSGQKIPEGYRETVLFRYCCALLRWGYTEDELIDAAQRWNRTRNSPPLHVMEARLTARSVYRNRRYRHSHGESVREQIADTDLTRLVQRGGRR